MTASPNNKPGFQGSPQLDLPETQPKSTPSEIAVSAVSLYLDNLHSIILKDKVMVVLEDLYVYLEDFRQSHSVSVWAAVVACCQKHPIKQTIAACRVLGAFERMGKGGVPKPGEAEWFLGYKPLKNMESIAYGSQTVRAVRERLSLMAEELDKTAKLQFPQNKILSIYNGFLRELEFTEAYRDGKVYNMTLLDTDDASLLKVKTLHENTMPLKSIALPLKKWRLGALPENIYGMAYSLSALDFLKDDSAKKMMQMAFHSLAKGGKMILANLLPHTPTDAFVEAFSRNHVKQRTTEELYALAACLPQEKIGNIGVFLDSLSITGYLSIEKA